MPPREALGSMREAKNRLREALREAAREYCGKPAGSGEIKESGQRKRAHARTRGRAHACVWKLALVNNN